MCFLSIINYSNILRIKIKSVYVKDFLISTKVRLKRGEHLHGEEPISSEPTFRNLDLRVQVHPGELWFSKQRVHIVLEASKSAGAKGDVPKICGFVHPLHPL